MLINNSDRTVFTFSARGHPNISATHETTLEVTRAASLTTQGDCIVGVSASQSLIDIPDDLKFQLRQSDAKIILELRIGGLYKTVIRGQGHPGLAFSSPEVMICRKSEYVDDCTLMIHSNIAAMDLSRDLVELLQDPNTKINFTLYLGD